jgi:hypothetical protein
VGLRYQPAEVVRELFVDIWSPSLTPLESAMETFTESEMARLSVAEMFWLTASAVLCATLVFTEPCVALLSAVLMG